jgi:ribosome biogenesis GTPase
VTPPGPRRDLDESDVRVRPNPRGSRPRTKERPRHEDSTPGWVVAVDRGRYTVLLGRPEVAGIQVTAMKARELGRAGVIVGDRVTLVGNVSGASGSLARIVRVEERVSLLRRSADDSTDAGDAVERPIVANADQLAIVTALADPEPRPRLIDRALVAAYDGRLEPLLMLTKADLRDPGPFLAGYATLDVPTVVTQLVPDPDGAEGARMIDGLGMLRERLAGRITVFLGHSGVGKSTLVNALVPGAARATAEVNVVTGRGRHTSSSAIAFALPGGGWVIDTPGVRSFGLAHVDPDRIVAAFADLVPGTVNCPRGCTHDEPDCALDDYVASGAAGPSGPARLESLRRLLRSRAGPDTPP